MNARQNQILVYMEKMKSVCRKAMVETGRPAQSVASIQMRANVAGAELDG